MAFIQFLIETLDPERFYQEEVQPRLGTMPLDPVDEKIIRIQLMRHDKVVNASHASNYLACRGNLSILPMSALHLFLRQKMALY